MLRTQRDFAVLNHMWHVLSHALQGNFDKAEPLHARAIAILGKTLGPNHPALATCLNNYAECLRDQVKDDICVVANQHE